MQRVASQHRGKGKARRRTGIAPEAAGKRSEAQWSVVLRSEAPSEGAKQGVQLDGEADPKSPALAVPCLQAKRVHVPPSLEADYVGVGGCCRI
jgi:hypothetical protein